MAARVKRQRVRVDTCPRGPILRSVPGRSNIAGYAASTCLWAPSLQVLGACKGLPEFEAAGPSSAFLNRKEVAVQHRGVTAGTEVHRCLGAVGRLQSEREVLCAWSGDAVALGYVSFLRVGSSK